MSYLIQSDGYPTVDIRFSLHMSMCNDHATPLDSETVKNAMMLNQIFEKHPTPKRFKKGSCKVK